MNFNHDTGSIDTILSVDTTTAPPLGGTVGIFSVVGTGGISLPSGTVAQRPTGALGLIRGNSDSALVEVHNGTTWLDITKQGTVTSIAVTGSTGLTVGGSPITTSGTFTLTLGSELQGFSSLATTGLVTRTAAGSFTGRTITGTASNIAVTNGDGVAGNPTINLVSTITAAGPVGSGTTVPSITFDSYGRLTAVASTAITFPVTSVFGRTGVVTATAGDYTLAQLGTVAISSPQNGNVLTYNGTNWINASPSNAGTVTSVAATGSTGLAVGGSPITSSGTLTFTLGAELQALAGLSATGLVTRTAANTYTSRTITGTAGNIAVTNGDGVSGAPTLNLATVTIGSSGTTFQKTSFDSFGRASNVSAVTTSDITALVDATYVNVTGDTMTGTLTFSSGTITGLPTPTNASDAAPKSYVDAAVTGLSWKTSVRAATTTAGTLSSSFANGSVVDGVTLATGDRLLIKNQATAAENGLYVVNASGAPTRASDADVGGELVGATVFVDQGTTNADTGWTQTANAPITLGTSNLSFAQFSGSGTYTAGTGLQLTGNTFSLVTPVSTANGGLGLSAVGSASQILGVTTGGGSLEYKTLTAGTGVSISPAGGAITINNTGVTSVALSLPSIFSVSGSPVTTTGTLTAALASQTQNYVFAAPAASGGTPAFRQLVAADLPFKLYAENPVSPTVATATGNNSVAIGSGAAAVANNSLAVGAGSSAQLPGSQALANGSFATAGDAQLVQFVLRNLTTSGTATELFLDGTAGTIRATPPNNSVWAFSMLVAARRTDATGGGAGYKIEGVLRRDTTAASTTLIGSVAKSTLGEINTAWDVSVTADTTNGALKVTVTGEASKTIRWTAAVTASQTTN